MTIASKITAETMLGDGANREFPFTFRAWPGEIRVVITAPDDTATAVTGLADIVVNETGGTVTYPKAAQSPALPAGWKITILRDMNFLQPVRLVNAARYDPVVIEQALDRLTATDQQLSEEVGRAITLAEGASQTPAILLDKIFTAETNAVNAAGAAASSASAAADSQAQSGQLATEAGLCAQDAQTAGEAAAEAEEMARKWAENPEDVPVRGTNEFSAYHWAQRAGEYASGVVPDASESQRGTTRYATAAEHLAGTNGVAAQPGHIRTMLFANAGAGPLLRGDIIPPQPVATDAAPGIVRPDGSGLAVDVNGVLSIKNKTASTQLLTASGTWTAPYHGFYFIEVQGGGGGSGAVWGSASCLATAGAGTGGYTLAVRNYAKGDEVSYTIGAGGAAGVPTSAGTGIGSGSGASGGATNFGGIAAAGGFPSLGVCFSSSQAFDGLYHGNSYGAMPGGMAGEGASLRYYSRSNSAFGGVISGLGGTSAFGQGGAESAVNANTTVVSAPGKTPPATNYGAGAGGAASNYSNAPGGNGAPGCVRVTFLGV